MIMKSKLFNKISLNSGLAVALAFALWTPSTVQAAPDLKGYERSLQMQGINTMAQAEALKPGDTFAMVCAKCKSVVVETVNSENGQIKDFTPGMKQLCPGCNSYITVGVGHYPNNQVTHTCEACGDGSAFCCATKPGTGATEGMEKDKK